MGGYIFYYYYATVFSDLEAVRSLQHQVMASEETLCIDVRHDYLLTDALHEARKKFDSGKANYDSLAFMQVHSLLIIIGAGGCNGLRV